MHLLLAIIHVRARDLFSSHRFLSTPSNMSGDDILHLQGDHPLETQVTQRLVARSHAAPPLFSAAPPPSYL